MDGSWKRERGGILGRACSGTSAQVPTNILPIRKFPFGDPVNRIDQINSAEVQYQSLFVAIVIRHFTLRPARPSSPCASWPCLWTDERLGHVLCTFLRHGALYLSASRPPSPRAQGWRRSGAPVFHVRRLSPRVLPHEPRSRCPGVQSGFHR